MPLSRYFYVLLDLYKIITEADPVTKVSTGIPRYLILTIEVNKNNQGNKLRQHTPPNPHLNYVDTFVCIILLINTTDYYAAFEYVRTND
jgi:hypothetical protein